MEGTRFYFYILIIFLKFTRDVTCVGHTPDQIKAITFNAALYDLPPEPNVVGNNRIQRLDKTIEALRDSGADLVCLQEIWFGQDLERIVNELDDVYKYSYSPIHTSDGTLPPQTGITRISIPTVEIVHLVMDNEYGQNNLDSDAPCNRANVLNLQACSIRNNCANPDLVTELSCGAFFCQSQLLQVLFEGQNCISCLLNSFENTGLAVERCSSDSSPTFNPRTVNTNGLALLSKRPLSVLESFNFYNVTMFIDKGYISARFDRELHVVCTHMTAILTGFTEPFNSQYYPTYQDQNTHETNVLISKYGHVSPLLLLGDMNNGDALTNKLVGLLPNNYRRMDRAFDTHIPARYCTFCSSDRNIYNTGEDPVSIDHIFGNGVKIVAAKVIFKPGDVNVSDVSGMTFPLSDHNGYQNIIQYTCGCVDPLLASNKGSNSQITSSGLNLPFR